jgi:hypothetical protein
MTETTVFAYYWGYGPIRWAFTKAQISADYRAIARHVRDTGHQGHQGPVFELLLEELPPEPELRLYVGA